MDVVGASAASKPNAPALNTIVVGGRKGSRLMFPVLPGNELEAKPIDSREVPLVLRVVATYPHGSAFRC